MPPKFSPPRVVYRTVKAKEMAEAREKASRRTAETTAVTATAPPSSILQKALDKWETLSSNDQTPAMAVIVTAEACSAARKLTTEPTYTGAVKLSRKVPCLTQTVLGIYKAVRARAGMPISEETLERALFPEYATNITFTNGTLKVVTHKYTGMDVLPGIEAVMKCGDGDDETLYPCELLVDLMFNCIKLKLCTLDDIKEFVNQNVWEGARAYLLSDEAVKQLVQYGIHEKFDASAVEDSVLVAGECVEMMDSLFPKAKKIKWEAVEEVPVPLPGFTFKEEEYYACD